jgi:hypothetical protein
MNPCTSSPLIALVLASAAAALPQEELQPPQISAIDRGERPDDPPGVPARPTPGAVATTVSLGPFTSVQVNVDANGANIVGDAANEPSIAVHPTDPTKMAIGWRQFATIASNFREAGVAYSQNGGVAWTFPGPLDAGVFRSDPVLTYDAQGSFYYNSLTTTPGFQVDVRKSTDGGVTWGTPVPAFGGDKTWFEIDRSGAASAGNIYQAWNIFGTCCAGVTFNRSVNGGASFQTPTAIPSSPAFGTLTVGPNGDVWVCGWNPSNLNQFLVSRSTDAKNPAVAVPSFTTTVVNLGGVLALQGGSSTPNPAGLLGQAWIAVDPTNGHVYVTCSVDPPGSDPMDLNFVRSEDDGQTWSTPLTINDDPVGSDNWQWFGTMSVAPNGRIDVAWNDTRRKGLANFSQVYYATSGDGGNTFSANVPMTPPFDSHVGFPQQNKLGDYYDMISFDNVAHLAYSATFNGEQDVYYLRICAGVPASSVVRNGSGVNPLGYSEIERAVVGRTWETNVDIASQGGTLSLVAVTLVPTSGTIFTTGQILGEVLCDNPTLLVDASTTGDHVLGVPLDCGLIGLQLCTQASVFDGAVFTLQNAIDITIGVL